MMNGRPTLRSDSGLAHGPALFISRPPSVDVQRVARCGDFLNRRRRRPPAWKMYRNSSGNLVQRVAAEGLPGRRANPITLGPLGAPWSAALHLGSLLAGFCRERTTIPAVGA